MLPEQRKFFTACLALAIGIIAFICSQGCPARMTSVPTYILERLPEKLSEKQQTDKKLSDDITNANTNVFGFMNESVFFKALVSPENRTSAENSLGPAALAFHQQLVKWQYARKARILYPIEEMRGTPTAILLQMFPILIENHSVSLELKNNLEKQLISAPPKKWGDFEKTLLALLYLSKRFTLSELSIFMKSITEPKQLLELAAFTQRMPLQTSHLLTLGKDVSSNTMEQFLRYLAKWNVEGVNALSTAVSFGPKAFNYLLSHQTILRHQGWPSYLPSNIIPFTTFDSLYLKYPGVAIFLRYAGILFSLLCIFISILYLSERISLHLVILYIMLAVVLTLLIMFSGETGTLTDPEIPVLKFSHSVADNFFLNESDAKGDSNMKFDILPLALTLFFLVIQAFLFFVGKTQIEKIQLQDGDTKLKLKLLENEEHLFDMGLYVGLSGTILSLIFLAMGWSGIGLVSAYTSTLFGIVGVALLKLLYVRPFKRKLIMENADEENI